MTVPTEKSFPRHTVQHYGSALIDGIAVPVAYGNDLVAYVPVWGVCDVLECDPEKEVERIKSDPALKGGLAYLPFRYKPEDQDWVVRDLPCISITHLHAWLLGISLEDLPSKSKQKKLLSFKNNAADIIYGYFARPLMPSDIKDEQKQFLTAAQRDRYGILEGLYMDEFPDLTDDGKPVKDEERGLVVAFSLEATPEFIDERQQKQFLSMVAILGPMAQRKDRGRKYTSGQTGFARIHAGFKAETGIPHYKLIPADRWVDVVKYMTRVYRGFAPQGKLPDVFEIALRTETQPPKKADQPRLFGI